MTREQVVDRIMAECTERLDEGMRALVGEYRGELETLVEERARAYALRLNSDRARILSEVRESAGRFVDANPDLLRDV